jgi:hypothetical protein
MQWFKHHNNFRNSPPMINIAECLGDRGVVAAYRLYEVMAEQCGSGADFDPVLVLVPPRDLYWLARELLIPIPEGEDYGDGVTPGAVSKILDCFRNSNLIYVHSVEQPRVFTKPDGTFETRTVKFQAIELRGFAAATDEYTSKELARLAKRGVNLKPGTKRLALATPKASATK